MRSRTGLQDKIVFSCDDKGRILHVHHDGLGLKDFLKPGTIFTSSVCRESLSKALNLILEIKRSQAAVDWELNLQIADSVATLHFSGVKDRCNILLVGSKTRRGLLEFFEDWIRKKNDEQETEALISSLHSSRVLPDETESAYFDELTRLYNEISTMHRDLAKKTADLERLNDLKNRFLGMAAHDLRTALWTIQLYGQFLLEETGDVLTEDKLEFLKTIIHISEDTKKIVEDYLDVSTIESGKLKLELQATDLIGLVRHNVEMNRALAARKRINLELAYEELPEVRIDASRIDQVLNNLINNAIKFSPQQTAIAVEVRRAGGEAVIRVTDEGVGIHRDFLSRIFEPFEGQRSKGTEEEKGSGLGLAIVQRIVQEHGGRVWAESKVGEGSSFYVALPLPE